MRALQRVTYALYLHHHQKCRAASEANAGNALLPSQTTLYAMLIAAYIPVAVRSGATWRTSAPLHYATVALVMPPEKRRPCMTPKAPAAASCRPIFVLCSALHL